VIAPASSPFEPLSVDRHLARMLAAWSSAGEAELVHDTVLLLGAVRADGGTCAQLADWSGRPLLAEGRPFPDPTAWRRALLASGLCRRAEDAGAVPAPLVIDGSDRLYVLRRFTAEQRVAAAIKARLGALPDLDETVLARALRELFPERTTPDWQAVAALAAARSRLAVITGGPGTGKTHTVARLLSLLLRLQPGLKIALAAPTGKAAARLQESLAEPGLREQLGAATTLHRLLGYRPHDDSFRFCAAMPLDCDVAVIDEASMMDLALCDALLAALRPPARLVLLGDRDQLASVAPGQVLGDLCRAARPERGAGAALARHFRALTGRELPQQDQALADHVVLLRENFRFDAGSGLGACAKALAMREQAAALAALRAGTAGLRWLQPGSPEQVLAEAEPPLGELLRAESAGQALAALGRFRVLCASRHGPCGVESINRMLERWLAQSGLRQRETWYQGRPVLVTRNDPFTRLSNGDLGVCWDDEEGRPRVWFQGRDGLRPLAPARMPPCETAFAMTVHKAQGSEFETVLLVLPDQDGPLCNASLVYTGLTRAQQRAVLCGSEAIVTAALGRWPDRSSGLGAALL
jgi:exodeoxyribonuclease V alpha subunit